MICQSEGLDLTPDIPDSLRKLQLVLPRQDVKYLSYANSSHFIVLVQHWLLQLMAFEACDHRKSASARH